MTSLIPAFDFQHVFIEPWTTGIASFGWIALMGFLVTAGCGLIGNFLLLRRMALVGDAISHSVLPGLAVAFLVSHSRGSLAMFLGALGAGFVTTVLIELIHKQTRVKQDAAIGITFSTLFAIGVLLVAVYADRIDLDQDCVLYGEIAFVPLEPMIQFGGITLGPESLVRMAAVTLSIAVLIALFYKELLVSSFDPGLARSLGIRASAIHYLLMGALSIVIVSAFQSAGAILVIAMLILPGSTARLLSDRLPVMLVLTVIAAALSAVLGMHLGIWLDCSMAGAMVLLAAALFVGAWIFSPSQGLLRRLAWSRMRQPPAGSSRAPESGPSDTQSV